MSQPPLLAATVTALPDDARGRVLVCGSHGGRYPGSLAAKAGLRAVIFSDAGIGWDEAGVASLALLQSLGVAACCLSHETCRIGDPADMLARGRVSRANAPASALGIQPGMACEAAVALLGRAGLVGAGPVPEAFEGRSIVAGRARRLVLVDSAAMVVPADAGQVVVTGSHGGLVGGDPALALRAPGFAAAFNDAGIGLEEAGTTRLPALEARGILAITVSAASARIGEARSTFLDGVISRANGPALRRGARIGAHAHDVLQAWSNDP